ncbi:hypothetical protein ASG93_04450 [Paenibacillus sp. Soil787]|nr:hypothetical protein ASG93_04450 [Paenibacillus sp. Soil787]
MAILHEHKIEEYERLHNHIPDEIVKQLLEDGYTNVRIYRKGITLIIHMENDEEMRVPNRKPNAAVEDAWHKVTSDCFLQSWEPLSEIFKINDVILYPES